MPSGILLSQDTYDRIMAVVEAYENDELGKVTAEEPLVIRETGPLGTVIGIDLGTQDLDVCVGEGEAAAPGTITVYTPSA